VTDEPNPRRPRREQYHPKAETLELLKVSGNPINGLGETTQRRPSPFFWHPPDQHPYGDLQIVARQSSRKCPGSAPAFMAAYNHPELIPVAEVRSPAPAEQLAREASAFALSHEADAVGIAPMDPLYVFDGYTIEEPWVIVLALAHNYERLKEVPSDETNGVGVTDIGDQYARGTRASFALAQLDSFPRLQRQRIPRTFGRRAASDPSGHCLRPGGIGQAWLIDQPAFWLGCASGRRHY
jgi:epoxyqueuosine reductase